jgi:hypothetical protein
MDAEPRAEPGPEIDCIDVATLEVFGHDLDARTTSGRQRMSRPSATSASRSTMRRLDVAPLGAPEREVRVGRRSLPA